MDIFKARTKKKPVPVIYPNLALGGNRAVKYSLSKTSSVQSVERELSIPSLPYLDRHEERKIANLVMLANKYYRQAKYRITEQTQFVIDIAKVIAVQFNAKLMYNKLSYPSSFDRTVKNLSKYHYSGEFREFEDAVEQELVDLAEAGTISQEARNPRFVDRSMLSGIKEHVSRDTYNYLVYQDMARYPLPLIHEQEMYNTVDTIIDMYYKTKDFTECWFYFLERMQVADFVYDLDVLQDRVSNGVRRNTMMGFSNEIIEAEERFFTEMIVNIIRIYQSGQRIPYEHQYKPYKEKYKWSGSRWLRTGMIVRKPKGLVRKIYNHYMLQSWMGRAYERKNTGVLLPSETAQQVKEAMSEGIKLPDELSDELKDKIIEEGNKNARFQYDPERVYESRGRHGKAYLRKFTPNDKVPSAIRQLQKRNADKGVVPRHMHRMTTDRKVFTTKKVVAGGSLMIDCSGSMSWDYDQLVELIEILPAVRIAGYEGYNTIKNGADGIIRIFAENGRLDSKQIAEAGYYGANSIDLEALKYLAKQPEPRIWVSDQAVVGVDDNGRANSLENKLKLEVLSFMVKNNIIPIKSHDLVLQVAKQLATSVKKKR